MSLILQEYRIRPDVEVANRSDVGCERAENEDFFLYIEPQSDEEFDRRGRLILVADGMGGCNGGEVASRLAAEVVRNVFVSGEESDPRAALIAGFQAAHLAVLDLAEKQPELHGMGTTCCAAILQRGRLYSGNIGDSRMYLVRNGRATPLTEDHSLVARLVRDGVISAEEARNHHQRNVLTDALGLEGYQVNGDFPVEPLRLEPGDVIMLSTDGLHGIVSDEEIAVIAPNQSLTEACRELVELAKERGGPDNITLQLLRLKCVEP